MEGLPLQAHSNYFMYSLPSSKLKPKLHHFRFLCSSSFSSLPSPEISTTSSSSLRKDSSGKAKLAIAHAQLKDNWLASLSCPFPLGHDFSSNASSRDRNAASECVIGVDPDVSGAVALLRTDESISSAQVIGFVIDILLLLLFKFRDSSGMCLFLCGFVVHVWPLVVYT